MAGWPSLVFLPRGDASSFEDIPISLEHLLAYRFSGELFLHEPPAPLTHFLPERGLVKEVEQRPSQVFHITLRDQASSGFRHGTPDVDLIGDDDGETRSHGLCD